MSSTSNAPYTRLERVLARIDFAWRVSGAQFSYIAHHGLWANRFRPGGPHGLWIAGHLAFYEASALGVDLGSDREPLEGWKDLFGNGSPCLDDLSHYPEPATVYERLMIGREAGRAVIGGFSDADLDRPVSNERLAIRDVQSQIEFMAWHDSHHAAQLGAIVNMHREGLVE